MRLVLSFVPSLGAASQFVPGRLGDIFRVQATCFFAFVLILVTLPFFLFISLSRFGCYVWVFPISVLSELHGCCHDRLLVISKSAIRSSLSVLRRYWLILRTSRSFSYEHSPRGMEESLNAKFNEDQPWR